MVTAADSFLGPFDAALEPPFRVAPTRMIASAATSGALLTPRP